MVWRGSSKEQLEVTTVSSSLAFSWEGFLVGVVRFGVGLAGAVGTGDRTDVVISDVISELAGCNEMVADVVLDF